MSFDKKTVVLEKLNKLVKLLEEVNKGDNDNLFHPDWILVTDTITQIERNNEASKETLDRMNRIWRKNQMIKKYKDEHNGELPPEDDAINMEIISLVNSGKKIAAIKFARENKMSETSGLMSVVEAKEYVDTLIKKNGL